MRHGSLEKPHDMSVILLHIFIGVLFAYLYRWRSATMHSIIVSFYKWHSAKTVYFCVLLCGNDLHIYIRKIGLLNPFGFLCNWMSCIVHETTVIECLKTYHKGLIKNNFLNRSSLTICTLFI